MQDATNLLNKLLSTPAGLEMMAQAESEGARQNAKADAEAAFQKASKRWLEVEPVLAKQASDMRGRIESLERELTEAKVSLRDIELRFESERNSYYERKRATRTFVEAA